MIAGRKPAGSFENFVGDKPGKKEYQRKECYPNPDPNEKCPLLVLFVRRGDAHHVMKHPHHGKQGLHWVERGSAQPASSLKHGCGRRSLIISRTRWGNGAPTYGDGYSALISGL